MADINQLCCGCSVWLECVPKSVSDADRRRIADLEETEARLRNETSKLKVWFMSL
jgi:hypothetical protein